LCKVVKSRRWTAVMFKKLEPLDRKYKESSIARMGDRMNAYRKFLATPTKVTMMNTLQDCLHDIYSKRPADPLLALSLRLQKKIATRDRQKTNDERTLAEVARLSDENHRLRLLLGPQGMDMAESMERMQITANENRATILGLENTRDCLEAEISALKQRLTNMQDVIAEKDSLIAQYAQSLDKYGEDETEAVIKIQALRRGVVQRQTADPKSEETADDASHYSSDESDDDHHFDGEIGHIDRHMSVGRRHHHGIKKRHHLVVKKRASVNSSNLDQTDGIDLKDLDREIDAMLSDDDRENAEQLDRKLQEILGDVDLDDAMAAATKIQAIQRGHARRTQEVDEDYEEDVAELNKYLANLDEQEVEHAVLKIQALARGRHVRNQSEEVEKEVIIGPQSADVEALQSYLEDGDKVRIHRSASRIQARFRGSQAREQVKHKREEEKAATHIQRIYRGKSARIETVRRRRSKRKPESDVREVDEVVVGPSE